MSILREALPKSTDNWILGAWCVHQAKVVASEKRFCKLHPFISPYDLRSSKPSFLSGTPNPFKLLNKAGFEHRWKRNPDSFGAQSWAHLKWEEPKAAGIRQVLTTHWAPCMLSYSECQTFESCFWVAIYSGEGWVLTTAKDVMFTKLKGTMILHKHFQEVRKKNHSHLHYSTWGWQIQLHKLWYHSAVVGESQKTSKNCFEVDLKITCQKGSQRVM